MKHLPTLIFTYIVLFCVTVDANNSIDWSYHSPNYRQTFCSPKSVDLNNDNYEDVIIGNMIFEQDTIYSEVICLSGVNGNIIWRCYIDSKYLYGNALFCNVDRDNIKDIILAGGFGGLYCINGRNGTLIWKFYNDSIPAEENNVFNFYNPKELNDQNGDGINDLLIINGGNQLIEPHAPGRKTGYLMIIDASNGQVISKDSFPDRKESYYSPIIFQKESDTLVLYGTGGETDSGSLWLCGLKDVRENKVFLNSTRIDGPYSKGFIQPCILANFNHDTVLDILSINLSGKIKLLDGSTYQTIWENAFDGFEIYTEPSIVYINSDNVPDIYLKLSKGEFNDESPYLGFRGILIDGQDGTYHEFDSLGYYYCFTTACSFIKDGQNKLIQIHNILHNDTAFVGLSEISITDRVSNDTIYMPFASCYNSTPLLKDLNNDKCSELITVFNTRDSGYSVYCKTMNIHADSIIWGTYYGNNNNSIFQKQNTITTKNEKHQKIKNIKILPNPSNNLIYLNEINSNIEKDIFIYNTKGGLIQSHVSIQENSIDISNLAKGTYILMVKSKYSDQPAIGIFVKI